MGMFVLSLLNAIMALQAVIKGEELTSVVSSPSPTRNSTKKPFEAPTIIFTNAVMPTPDAGLETTSGYTAYPTNTAQLQNFQNKASITILWQNAVNQSSTADVLLQEPSSADLFLESSNTLVGQVSNENKIVNSSSLITSFQLPASQVKLLSSSLPFPTHPSNSATDVRRVSSSTRSTGTFFNSLSKSSTKFSLRHLETLTRSTENPLGESSYTHTQSSTPEVSSAPSRATALSMEYFPSLSHGVKHTLLSSFDALQSKNKQSLIEHVSILSSYPPSSSMSTTTSTSMSTSSSSSSSSSSPSSSSPSSSTSTTSTSTSTSSSSSSSSTKTTSGLPLPSPSPSLSLSLSPSLPSQLQSSFQISTSQVKPLSSSLPVPTHPSNSAMDVRRVSSSTRSTHTFFNSLSSFQETRSSWKSKSSTNFSLRHLETLTRSTENPLGESSHTHTQSSMPDVPSAPSRATALSMEYFPSVHGVKHTLLSSFDALQSKNKQSLIEHVSILSSSPSSSKSTTTSTSMSTSSSSSSSSSPSSSSPSSSTSTTSTSTSSSSSSTKTTSGLPLLSPSLSPSLPSKLQSSFQVPTNQVKPLSSLPPFPTNSPNSLTLAMYVRKVSSSTTSTDTLFQSRTSSTVSSSIYPGKTVLVTDTRAPENPSVFQPSERPEEPTSREPAEAFEIWAATMTIENMEFTSELTNSSSKAFNDLANDLKMLLNNIFEEIHGFLFVEVKSFESGSIICLFFIHTKVGSSAKAKDFEEALIDAANTGKTGNYHITSVEVEDNVQAVKGAQDKQGKRVHPLKVIGATIFAVGLIVVIVLLIAKAVRKRRRRQREGFSKTGDVYPLNEFDVTVNTEGEERKPALQKMTMSHNEADEELDEDANEITPFYKPGYVQA